MIRTPALLAEKPVPVPLLFRRTLPLLLAAALAAGCGRPAVNASSTVVSPGTPPVAKATTQTLPPTAKTNTGPAKPAEPVRAIYLSGYTTGTKDLWSRALSVVDKTEINAVVIDVREDGMISYVTDIPLAKATGANKKLVLNIDEKLAECKKRNIFTIARITVFRDKIVPRKRPNLAIQFPDGSPWRDRAGHYWLDPYNTENWDYAVDLASDAAKRGFDEIQWDYVRFPSEGKRATRRYPARKKGETRSEARVIADFCKYAKEKLEPLGVALSADVFGLATSADDDLGIGQKLTLMAPHLDVICPMVYPSHYGRGAYGIAHPNASPYRTVLIGLRAGNKRLKGIDCKQRPWLQDFSLGKVRYGEKQVRAQIKAARDNGIREYLLWNASNRYTTAALVPPKPKKTRTSKKPAVAKREDRSSAGAKPRTVPARAR